MDKYERTLTGHPDELLSWLHHDMTIDDSFDTEMVGVDYIVENVRLVIRVYEHTSFIENNRLSLTLALVADGEQLFVSAIVSGGGHAVFFETPDWGAGAYMERLIESLERYIAQTQSDSFSPN